MNLWYSLWRKHQNTTHAYAVIDFFITAKTMPSFIAQLPTPKKTDVPQASVSLPIPDAITVWIWYSIPTSRQLAK